MDSQHRQSRHASISSLPSELLLDVAERLPWRDMQSLSRSSLVFTRTILSSPLFCAKALVKEKKSAFLATTFILPPFLHSRQPISNDTKDFEGCILSILIKHLKPSETDTAIVNAVIHRHIPAIRLLARAGADFYRSDGLLAKAVELHLDHDAHRNYFDIFQELLALGVSTLHPSSFIALKKAVWKPSVLKYLIDAGVPANPPVNKDGIRCLHQSNLFYASQSKALEAIKILVEAGASGIIDEALCAALADTEEGHVVLKCLITAGFDINKPFNRRHSQCSPGPCTKEFPIIASIYAGNETAFYALIEGGADFNGRSNEIFEMHMESKHRNRIFPAMHWAVEQGMRINDHSVGRQLLMRSIRERDWKLARLLQDAGANVSGWEQLLMIMMNQLQI
ncbi:hypothetical protein HDU97_006358 [Phlyctochytrium planicorne]|nr:hypothetical protein HDU97_006358 [Phlyctochytrium planicorne]